MSQPEFGLLSLYFVNHVSITCVKYKEKKNMQIRCIHSPCKVYLFDTKHLLLHLAAVDVDIDVLDSNHLANETESFDAKPFPVAVFPMDQG